MTHQVIHTELSPAAIGTYSQAIKTGNLVFISGQIPLLPATMELVSDNFEEQAFQAFSNLKAICEASGGTLADAVKVNISMTDLSNFPLVNKVMEQFFHQPYPARAAVGVAQLPKGSQIEIEAILSLSVCR
ncbi:MAG: reactive intermediate/imine deaminase [Gammaproteobacteria bacterium CG22_combo_CG10-13_8_21_14_all_40_8]|nr:MAG: reactive intermediate/imine deaminase [Gammaproteobacteria bacterium CG22_combo_CG10-13_8_21_14_all_40_8]